MKVKKFNNLWTMGVVLALGLLIGIYVLKFFFPEIVIEVAQIDSICRIGHYIDSHKWAWYLATFIISYIMYFFYCCACSERRKLQIKDHLFIAITLGILFLVKEFLPKFYTPLNYISMVLLPFITSGKFKNTTIAFSTLMVVQFFTLEIRNINTMVADYNFASFIILLIDYYIFQVLLYFLFNFKKEEI